MDRGFKLSPGGRKRLIGRWNALLSSQGIDPNEHFSMLDDLLTRHTEPQRFYHNLVHLDNLLQLLPAQPHLEFAVWFHDAIYDPTRTDNEAQSALLAEQSLRRLGVAPEVLKAVTAIIRATENHQSDDPDTALLLDADLSILGAEPETYHCYAQAIRQEYAWLPEPLFLKRRAAVLQKFLSRRRIYQTEAFARLEQPARENLLRELEQIAGAQTRSGKNPSPRE
jgi:predicted metal-dependent HD superfamily phosphohydrolase